MYRWFLDVNDAMYTPMLSVYNVTLSITIHAYYKIVFIPISYWLLHIDIRSRANDDIIFKTVQLLHV